LVTGIIIAGGNSTRMGSDKSLLNSNVERLNSELEQFGCNRIITMCGSVERIELFPGECIPDSKENLARSLLDIISTIEGEIQLVACDAYLADSELFHRITGCLAMIMEIANHYLLELKVVSNWSTQTKFLRFLHRFQVAKVESKQGILTLLRNSRRFNLSCRN